MAALAQLVERHLLVVALRADDAGEPPALSEQRASVEDPLHQPVSHAEHRKAQLHLLAVLEIAGVDRLVGIIRRYLRQKRFQLVRPDRDDRRVEVAQLLQMIDGRAQPHFAAVFADEVERGLGKEPGQVNARQEQVARVALAGERVAQHREKHVRRRLVDGRVERGYAKWRPKVMSDAAVLAMVFQQPLDGDVAGKAKSVPCQGTNEPYGADALSERNSPR